METPASQNNVDRSFMGRRWERMQDELLAQKALEEMENQSQPAPTPPNEIYDQFIRCASFATRRELQERQKAIDEFAHQFAVVDNTRKEMVRREAERTLTNEVLENEAMKNGFDATIEQFDRNNRDTTPPDLSA